MGDFDQKIAMTGDFPGDPVVKTLPSNAMDVALIPGWGARIPHALWSKKQNVNNRSNIVTNSIRTIKMVHFKKKKNMVMEGKYVPGKNVTRDRGFCQLRFRLP